MEPIAKVGGLADVIGALPRKLINLGCDVRVVIPFYRDARENIKTLKLRSNRLKEEIITCIDWLPVKGEVHEIRIHGVQVYLLRNDALYDREHIYTPTEGEYDDNDLRFGFLALGALEIAKTLNFKPDIIHCHDWQTSLVPVCLRWRKHLKDDPFFRDSKIIFTIHNLAFQGQFNKDILDKFGLPWFLYTPHGIEFYGKVNLLKGGITYSDCVTTVSQTYAEEIKTAQYGYGLDGILRSISLDSNNVIGILNGIDYDEWNPQTDQALYTNYDVSEISGKSINKTELLKEVGLTPKDDQPLLGMVSRLTEQKGTDLVVDSLPQIFDLGYQVVILGDGEERYERMLAAARNRFRNSLSVVLGFNNELARKIYAGCDFFLMPSRYEPCGLGQLIALRYGSIPIVRGTGGLADTVVDYTYANTKGNGFVFYEFSKVSFLDALIRALSLYDNKLELEAIIQRAMNEDFSWKRSSHLYYDLYQRVIKTEKKGKDR
jgi:starch synthase